MSEELWTPMVDLLMFGTYILIALLPMCFLGEGE